MAKTRVLMSQPGAREHRARVERENDAFRVVADGDAALDAVVIPTSSDVFTVFIEGATHEVVAERDDGDIVIVVGTERFRFEGDANTTAGAGRSASGRQELKAPMPGKVVKLLAPVGQEVKAGEGVVLFEAMKMQNEIRSPVDGVVAEVHVEEGTAVEAKVTLLTINAS